MLKKYVFLDIDGTFRDPFYGIPESAVKAVMTARRNGHSVIICTGRTMGLIPDDIDKSAFDGFIAGGGCYVEYRGNVIFDSEFSPGTVLDLCNDFRKLGVSHRIETKTSVYMTPDMADKLGFLGCSDDMNSELRQMTARNNKFQFRYTIDDFRREPVPASKICTLSSNADFEKILPLLDDFYVIKHTDPQKDIVNLEIVQKGCDKGSGIRRLAEFSNIETEDTVAFGDSMNDCEMFSAVSLKAAMANGDPKLIEMADIVCPHIMDDGLMTGFKKAGLI
ncbi:MAG: HAD-IIB family hydrolase [Porcipelethomonas sp.]